MKKFQTYFNIILILIILLLLYNIIQKNVIIAKLKNKNKKQVIKSYQKFSISRITDKQLNSILIHKNLFVFKDYRGKRFKHLNISYKYMLNKKNNLIHKVKYPGGSAAYATSLNNRVYFNDLNKFQGTQYKYCRYCFPEKYNKK